MKTVTKTEVAVLSAIIGAVIAVAVVTSGCTLVDDAASRIHDRLPHIQAKAPEIAADVATENWAELARDVAEALGYDEGEVTEAVVARLAERAEEIRRAAEDEDWLALALVVIGAL